ncbi:chemotaxis protein MotB [Pelagirhabdus alkalitolerans]|uniref:Chemotaxis protein MotB n=1 Tax=Pelagirhabdus alkalitolerans TaxID=1612202 RepID=A0A1G6HIE8_9BACI|nr:flagellar motor protein MotS [Pelagirhabdus alkalitolerans]SDB94097.1 chemotaxis protein MotB [Pelagirhabdus alkalitolerans]
MKLRKKKQSKGSPKWMTTFADMMTLILVFFILLFSMSQIDAARFEAVAESFRNRMVFDGFPSPVEMDQPSDSSDMRDQLDGMEQFDPDFFEDEEDDETDFDEDELEEDEDSLDELLQEVEMFLEDNQLEEVISANRTDQGVVLILQERILFDTGEAVIKSEGEPFLDKIALLLSNIPNYVRVEGHTDDRPISTPEFPSNWELSGARASSVIRHIIDANDFEEDRFMAVGYGDTRPIVPNDSPENWQRNRRVEVVILSLSESTD